MADVNSRAMFDDVSEAFAEFSAAVTARFAEQDARIADLLDANNRYLQEGRDARAHLRAILAQNADFRIGMPKTWEGDPLQDACEKAEKFLGDGSQRSQLEMDARRYRYLRERDLDTISKGGVFAGMTPKNVVLNGEELDEVIDAAMAGAKG